jgi:hypothetical protein
MSLTQPKTKSSFGTCSANEDQPNAARSNNCTLPVFGTHAIGLAWRKRSKTSFIVSCMRLFGLCSIRVALEASLTSRRRFGTCVIAPKTCSERIVISQVHTRSTCSTAWYVLTVLVQSHGHNRIDKSNTTMSLN